MEGRRKGTTVQPSRSKWKEMRFPSLVWLFPNGMTAAEGFRRAPYLAAEFAVLQAMQGETTRDVNNRQSHQSDRRELIRHEKQGVNPSGWFKDVATAPVFSLLTDVSGSFLPPLFGQFLSLLWAHRICWERKRFQCNVLSWTCEFSGSVQLFVSGHLINVKLSLWPHFGWNIWLSSC